MPQRLALGAALAGTALLAITLVWQPWLERRPSATVVIGSKGFTEQLLLGELLAQEIEARTALHVKREFSLGSTFLCHEAVRQGRVDGYVEYTGTAWSAILKQPSGPGASDRASLWSRARRLYAERYGLRMFPSLGFENTFAILIRQAQGQQLGLRTISQAVQPARRWRAAFGYEFLNRGDGYPGLASRYGLRFVEPSLLGRDVAFALELDYSKTNSSFSTNDNTRLKFQPSLNFPVSENCLLQLL